VLDHGLTLVTATHPDSPDASEAAKKYLRYGASPRAAQAIVTAGRVYALLDGRFNVSKEDLRRAALPVLRHRVIANFEAEADGITTDRIVNETVAHVESGDRDPLRL
jgi:MoxR-like ATPase